MLDRLLDLPALRPGPGAMADANAAVAAQLRSRFPGLPVIGVGHSMGGALAVLPRSAHCHNFASTRQAM